MDPHPPFRGAAAAGAAGGAGPASPDAEPTPVVPGAAEGEGLMLALEPADLPELRRHRRVRELAVGRASLRHLHAVVYDTPRLDLLREGLVLEVRRAGRRFAQAVRLLGSRDPSSEAVIPTPEPHLERIASAALRARVQALAGTQPLQPVLEIQLSRTRRPLRSGDLAIALELDVGQLRIASGSIPVCALSLRCAGGGGETALREIYALAAELQRTVRLRIEARTPLEQAISRLSNAPPAPQYAGRVRFPDDATLEQVIEASLADAFSQVLANEEPARRGIDPEGVHQMRVGVRRLRSALSLFREFLPAEALQPIREELRWLAGELGAVRDLDVFDDETLAPLCRMRPDDPHLKELGERVAVLRTGARERLRAALDSLRHAELMLRLGGFVYGRAWRAQALSPESARLFQPAEEPARALLARRRRKVKRAARDIARASDAERHALRIETKKLRYAAEFLRSLFPGRGAKRFLSQTRALQDHLGHLNDAATARRLLAQALVPAGREADTDLQRAASFVEGWSARGAAQALEGLPDAVDRLLARRPFWTGRR